MVTPSDALPFRVWFETVSVRSTYAVTFFVDAEDELLVQQQPSVTLTENVKCVLHFTSDRSDARLYLDVLDALPSSHAYTHSDAYGLQYISPGTQPIPLYWEGYVPWRPAVYHLRINVDERWYFASILVKSKLMNDVELETMRAELQSDVQHLAFELSHRSAALPNSRERDSLDAYLARLQLITSHARHVVAAAIDLMARANHGIAKSYVWVPADGGVETDEWSARRMVHQPPARGLMLSPRRVLHHDKPENRWVVYITEYALGVLTDGLAAADAQWRQLDADAQTHATYATHQALAAHERDRKRALMHDVEMAIRDAQRVLHALRRLQTADWYQSIRPHVALKGAPPFTHVIVSDARYRVFHRLYRELKSATAVDLLERRYDLQWRPTSQLYEMWGFVQVVRSLEALGFAPAEEQQGRWLVGSLHPGALVERVRQDTRLHLYYDAEIPSRAANTTPDSPIYTTNKHNRPDGRMDVYRRETYCGSLMFDCKYRPVADFWEWDTSPGMRPRAMEQITAYLDGPKSRYLHGEHRRPVNTLPVQEVWVIHPSGPTAVKSFDDYFVRLVRARPGENNEHIRTELRRVVDALLRSAQA